MTIATNMSHVVEFSDAFPIAAIVSTLSRQLSWSKSCMQHCLKRVSGWHGAGCCWGTWMMSDDMKVSKGLKFPVVALPCVGYMPAKGEDKNEAARVRYVAAARATQRLVLTTSSSGGILRGLTLRCNNSYFV
jgi:hypothetical protein